MEAGSGSQAVRHILDAAVAAAPPPSGGSNTGLTEQDLQRLIATSVLRGVDPAQVLQLRGLPLAPQLTLQQLLSLQALIMQHGEETFAHRCAHPCCSELLDKLQQLPEVMALSPGGVGHLLFAGGDPKAALIAAVGHFCKGFPAMQQQLPVLLFAAADKQYYNLMQVLLELPAAQELDVTRVLQLLQQVPVTAGGREQGGRRYADGSFERRSEEQQGMVHAKLLLLPAAQWLQPEPVLEGLQEAVAVEHCLYNVINLLGKLPAAKQLGVAAFEPLLVAYMGTAARVEGASGSSVCCSFLTLPAVQGISSTAWVGAMDAAVSRGECSEDDNDMAELLKVAAAQQLRSSEDLLPLLHVAMKQGHVQAVRGLVVLPAAQPGVLTSEGFWGACVTGVKAGFWGWYSCLPLNPYGQQLGPGAVAALLQEGVIAVLDEGVKQLVQLPAAKQIGPEVLVQLLQCLLWVVETERASPSQQGSGSCGAFEGQPGSADNQDSWANPPREILWSAELPDVLRSAMQEVPEVSDAPLSRSKGRGWCDRSISRMLDELLSLPAVEEMEEGSWGQLMQRSVPFQELEQAFQKVVCRRHP